MKQMKLQELEKKREKIVLDEQDDLWEQEAAGRPNFTDNVYGPRAHRHQPLATRDRQVKGGSQTGRPCRADWNQFETWTWSTFRRWSDVGSPATGA